MGLMVLGPSAQGSLPARRLRRASRRSSDRGISDREGQCSQLPAGLEVKGLGSSVGPWSRARPKVASMRDDDDVTFSLLSRITGSATDNFGGKYVQLSAAVHETDPDAGVRHRDRHLQAEGHGSGGWDVDVLQRG